MKPILFNTEMVRAILEGRKTLTRRAVKPQPPATSVVRMRGGSWDWSFWADCNAGHLIRPPYHPGDILWVRETWCGSLGQAGKYFYRAYPGERDEMKEFAHSFNRWHPSIHMPKEAARLFLRVTAVRVERLQEITEEQAEAEGAYRAYPYTEPGTGKTVFARDERATYRGGFSAIWDSTIKPADLPIYGWAANPWVWVIEFERVSKEAVQREEGQ